MQTLTADELKTHMAGMMKIPVTRLDDDANLADLVTDSFALVELSIGLQEDYNIVFRQADLAGIRTVADVINLVLARVAA